MKVAVLSESEADETGVRIFVDAILQTTTEPTHVKPRRLGWPHVLKVLPNVLLQMHYHTDADALAVVVDSNDSPCHPLGPDGVCQGGGRCRLCLLGDAVSQTLARARPRSHMPALKIAIGLAVPAIEAWYLFGMQAGMSEGAWIRGMAEGHCPYKRGELKRAMYGTDRPPLRLMIERIRAAGPRLIGQANLQGLERNFPVGFGQLASAVRGWRSE